MFVTTGIRQLHWGGPSFLVVMTWRNSSARKAASSETRKKSGRQVLLASLA